MAVLILLIGMLVLLIRHVLVKKDSVDSQANTDKTIVRSWLAVVLVAGLLLFATGSFFIANANLQNLLMGGVIASAGTAVAFYFSSRSSEQTQQNLLNALGSQITLPDLTAGTVGDAQNIAAALPLTLVISPAGSAPADSVTSTSPPPGSIVRPGTVITVRAKPA
jgi:hydroxymethylglutaryl-CoA reductase